MFEKFLCFSTVSSKDWNCAKVLIKKLCARGLHKKYLVYRSRIPFVFIKLTVNAIF